MARTEQKNQTADEFELDIFSGDTDLFRWFLLCYLFGKPIRSESAVATWKLFITKKLDTPWAITDASERRLVSVLREGGYTRYQHVTRRRSTKNHRHYGTNHWRTCGNVGPEYHWVRVGSL